MTLINQYFFTQCIYLKFRNVNNFIKIVLRYGTYFLIN